MSEIHFLSKLSLPFYTFVFTLAENMSLLPGLHVQRSARQQHLMKILSLREREVLKQLKKDPSTTVVASVRSTGATVVGSVNATEFGKGEYGLPHFYYCSVAKWILQFHSDPLLGPGSQMIYYSYRFLRQLLLYLLPSHRKNLERN